MLELFGQRTADKVIFEESFGKFSIAMNIDFEMANVCGVTFQNNDVHIQT